MPKTYARAETMLLWGDYFNHLARCGNLDLQNQHGESLERSSNIDLLGEKELIDGIASGKVQLAQVNPWPGAAAGGRRPAHAVRLRAGQQGIGQAQLLPPDPDCAGGQPYKEPSHLIGKKIAHLTPTSNSGNLAPRALFPAIGLVPDKNYEVVFSNGHERSVTGVMHGFYPQPPWPVTCTSAWCSGRREGFKHSHRCGKAPLHDRDLDAGQIGIARCAKPRAEMLLCLQLLPKLKAVAARQRHHAAREFRA